MTPWALVALALQGPTPASPTPFGGPSVSSVRGVDPDANAHDGDGAYGRFDGDLDLGLGVGPNVAFSGSDVGITVRGTAYWYSTIGLDLAYAETLNETPDLERRLALGVSLKPLFLLRWSNALESGPAVLDLALDSLALGLGASFAQPRGRGFGSRTAFETSLAAGVPLVGSAAGPWIEFRAGLSLPSPRAGEASAMLLFAWHFTLLTPVVTGD